eukprot:SAG31_NODE_1303_length_8898_cov_11.100693_4_plen_286_part_01
MGPGSPMEKVGLLLEENKATLLEFSGEAAAITEVFVTGAWKAQTEWMETVGKELIDSARHTAEQAEVPVTKFLFAGTLAALPKLRDQLSEHALNDYANHITKVLDDNQNTTMSTLLRTIDQNIQHIIMDKVQTMVFPTLGDKFDGLGIELPSAMLKRIKRAFFDMVEDLVRQNIHRNMYASVKDVTKRLCPADCLAITEKLQKKQKVDAWGWLVHDGGFAKFRKRNGGGMSLIMDLIDKIVDPAIITQLKEAVDEIMPVLDGCSGSSQQAFDEWSAGQDDLLLSHL